MYFKSFFLRGCSFRSTLAKRNKKLIEIISRKKIIVIGLYDSSANLNTTNVKDQNNIAIVRLEYKITGLVRIEFLKGQI